jgi:hypothetical protein
VNVSEWTINPSYLFVQVQQIIPASDNLLLARLEVSEVRFKVIVVIPLWGAAARSGLINRAAEIRFVQFSPGFVAFAFPILCKFYGIQLRVQSMQKGVAGVRLAVGAQKLWKLVLVY